MKILFVYPSWTGEYGMIAHFAKRSGVYPPLNLALLAAIAEQHGHTARIIDAEAQCLSMKQLIRETIAQKPDVIALSGKSPFFHLTKQFAEGIKESGCSAPIVVGGQHITIMKEQVFFADFDYGFVGECEDTWPQFLNCLDKGEDISHIPGIIYRKNKNMVFTGAHRWKRDLDSLPFPARHLLPMERYKLGTLYGRKNFTSIQTVRGCPWKCIFCASETLNTTNVAKRSPQSVIAEIKEVINKFHIRHFMIIDDVLTLDRKHIMGLCESIIEAKMDITFEGSTRANLVDEDLIRIMKKAGLIRLSFGLESVDSEIRRTMKKKVPLEHYAKANELLGKYNIEALNSVMLGLPGETQETVMKTLDFLRNDRHVKQANFAIAIPYPGTEFYDMAKSGKMGMKLMTDDFSEYRRYGTAVTEVGSLSQRDLIDLQNEGFVRIYSAPWRWMPMLRKHGIIGGVLMMFRVLNLAIKKSVGWAKPFRVYPGVP